MRNEQCNGWQKGWMRRRRRRRRRRKGRRRGSRAWCHVRGTFEEVSKESWRKEGSEMSSKQHSVSNWLSCWKPASKLFGPPPQTCHLCDIFDTPFQFFFVVVVFKILNINPQQTLAASALVYFSSFLPTGLSLYSTTLILKVTRPRNLSLSSSLRRSEPSTLHSTASSLL